MTELFDPLAASFRLDGTGGEAVVAVHGFTGVPAHFRLLAPILNEAGYTVVVPRLAGHGTSIDDLATTFAEDWLRSARLAVESVGDHDRVHLVGLSMGGLLALVLAVDRPVASVTTISSPLRFRNRQIYFAAVMHRLRPRAMWPEDDAVSVDDEAAPLWLTYPGFPTRQLGELVSLSRRARRAASKVVTPLLVIQPRADESVDPRSAELLCAAKGGGCRIVWLERSIHNALLGSERAVVHREVLTHLQSV
jgi:carboxylesterase